MDKTYPYSFVSVVNSFHLCYFVLASGSTRTEEVHEEAPMDFFIFGIPQLLAFSGSGHPSNLNTSQATFCRRE